MSDESKPADYGVSVAAPSPSGMRRLPFLARGCLSLLQSRSLPRLVRALDHNLAHLEQGPLAGSIRIDATAAVLRGDRGVVVPRWLVERGTDAERTMHRLQLRLADSPAPRIDPINRVLVIPAGLADTSLAGDLGDASLLAAAGEYELRGLILDARSAAPEETAAGRLVRVLRHVEDRGSIDARALLTSLNELLAASTRAADRDDRRGAWESVAQSLG